MHDLLVARGSRGASEISLVMPLPRPIPPSPDASQAVLEAFGERGIRFHPDQVVRRLDPDRHVAMTASGDEFAYDLLLAVPKHRAPAVVVDAGLTVDGWIPVDPATLETRFPDVYAVGDVTSIGTPKAGTFAEGQAAVVAAAIVARIRGGEHPSYDGRGVCYMEMGSGQVAQVDVTFQAGRPPYGRLVGPSADLAGDKAEFGTTRVRRWFRREWATG
jgi:sulfide:quinone oxidoreductase